MINVLLQGDCLHEMNKIADKSINLILTDLPYGITKNTWDKPIDLPCLWQQYQRVIKDNGAIVLFACQPYTSELVLSNAKLFRYSLVWHKTNPVGFLNSKKMPLRSHEDILVFYKKLPTYNPQKTTGHIRKTSTAKHKRNSKKTTNYGFFDNKTYDSTERYPTSILTFARDTQKLKLHSTQKPLALLQYLIKTYTNPGDIVLDSCMGSGSTCIAAINTERKYIGIEKNTIMFRNAENWIVKERAER